MINIRKAHQRGSANFGWLQSKHSFSFGSYYDPRHMGFRKLRVINDDRVTAGQGFGKHPHRAMEIISYVVSGAMEHGDSMGNSSVIRAGEFQRMSAGTGVFHSEFNHDEDSDLHFYQIWIETAAPDIAPEYEQKQFADSLQPGKWLLVASEDGRDRSLTVHQDVSLYQARIGEGESLTFDGNPERYYWLQVVKGSLSLNGESLGTGDGAAVSEESRLVLSEARDAEVLLFDLA